MIAQVESPVKPQIKIDSLVSVTLIHSGEETTKYLVRVDVGAYDEQDEVLKVGPDYYCECSEYQFNAQHAGHWTCLHVEAVKAAELSGQPIEEEPIPFE